MPWRGKKKKKGNSEGRRPAENVWNSPFCYTHSLSKHIPGLKCPYFTTKVRSLSSGAEGVCHEGVGGESQAKVIIMSLHLMAVRLKRCLSTVWTAFFSKWRTMEGLEIVAHRRVCAQLCWIITEHFCVVRKFHLPPADETPFIFHSYFYSF